MRSVRETEENEALSPNGCHFFMNALSHLCSTSQISPCLSQAGWCWHAGRANETENSPNSSSIRGPSEGWKKPEAAPYLRQCCSPQAPCQSSEQRNDTQPGHASGTMGEHKRPICLLLGSGTSQLMSTNSTDVLQNSFFV